MMGGEGNEGVVSLAQGAGVKWARVIVYWSSIEPSNTTPEHYTWGGYDASFSNLTQAGITPIADVMGNPPWAATTFQGPIDLVDLSEFAQFMGALVERYDGDGVDDAPGSPVVRYWQLYNEPDDLKTWGGHGGEYAQMLKAVHPAVHGADPQGKVVLGGLAYDWWPGYYPFDLEFLDDVVAAGGGAYFDLWAYHFYPRQGGKWSPPNVVGKALAVREKLPQGLRGKAVLCTEVGEPYTGGAPDWPRSHELASRYVVQAFVQGMGAGDYGLQMPALIWFTMDYYDDGRKFGLLDEGGEPNPEYYAYQTLAEGLEGWAYERALGVSGVEGYVFGSVGGEKVVVGAAGEGGEVLSFGGGQLRVVDKFGQDFFI